MPQAYPGSCYLPISRSAPKIGLWDLMWMLQLGCSCARSAESIACGHVFLECASEAYAVERWLGLRSSYTCYLPLPYRVSTTCPIYAILESTNPTFTRLLQRPAPRSQVPLLRKRCLRPVSAHVTFPSLSLAVENPQTPHVQDKPKRPLRPRSPKLTSMLHATTAAHLPIRIPWM
jgi:hypothetical protein